MAPLTSRSIGIMISPKNVATTPNNIKIIPKKYIIVVPMISPLF
jgi:hypothetical protein